MCGRYILVQKTEIIENRFNVEADKDIEPSFNISPGKFAAIITDDNPQKLQFYKFGLTPFWAKKQMYFFNARAEGDKNKDNNPDYKGGMGILNKPSFRKPIRSRRCLVIADAFIEGSTKEGLDKAHLVYLINDRPFAFAGIWDKWENKENGEIVNSFSIITTVSNGLLQKIPHHRSPVILNKNDESKWLNKNTDLSDITKMLKPYDASLMNAYPISNKVKNPRNDSRELINPVGERLNKEEEIRFRTDLKLQGMGSNKKNRK